MPDFTRVCASVTVATLVAYGQPAAAHNAHTHHQMTDFAYQVMRLVALPEPPGRLVSHAGDDDADWQAFLADVAAAVPKLQALPAGLGPQPADRCLAAIPLSDWAVDKTLGTLPLAVSAGYATGSAPDCGADSGYSPGPAFAEFAPPGDFTGTGLGFWAQSIDDEFDDFHGQVKPLNALGAGYLKDKLSDLWDAGVAILLVPLICLGNCLFGLFGDCDDCLDQAAQAGADSNPVTAIETILPGFGDFSGGTYTGLWHFINVRPGASNEYDDRQGMFYEEAGPVGVPGAVDLAIMIGADAIGLTLDAGDSLGDDRYQIEGADDDHPDTSPVRHDGAWEVTTIGHLNFEPVDNLGYYGWRQFKDDPTHNARWLAWPLHALGDATVPMHVAGTTSWGHRPYEDAQERLYGSVVGNDGSALQQVVLARQVLLRAFEWWKLVRAWRVAHGSEDVPVREMITTLASTTYEDAMTQFAGGSFWPFNDVASVAYLVADETSTELYTSDPDAVDLSRTPMFDGMGATIALLTATGDLLP